MRNYRLFLVIGLVLSTVACSDFGDMNVNPNNASSPNISSLFTESIRLVGGLNGDVRIVGPRGGVNMLPALYVQQFGDVTYVEESRYKTINFEYNAVYSGALMDLQQIITENSEEKRKGAASTYGSNNHQLAIARILKAYIFQWLTDRWGDIPYSQALKGDKSFSPVFDKQQDIYTDLFKEWKEAAAQFDGGPTIKGDILLNGNVTRWKKFAASLRLIAALRLSKVDSIKGKTEFTAALADGVLTSNADNIQYQYLSDASNENQLYRNYVRDNRKDFAVSNVFIDYLKKVNDPRLPFIATKNQKGEYVGVPYGVFPSPGKAQDFSLAGSILTQQNSPINIITYAQVLLAQAEAAKRGWTAGDAKALYEAAIKASMQQWMGTNYDEAAYKAYIAQPDVAYTPDKAIEQIGYQRWIALFFQGTEAWSEWRRTGFPVLKPAPTTLNGGTDIPRRLGYPVTEPSLNGVNYQAVIARQGKDDHYSRVWWDKK